MIQESRNIKACKFPMYLKPTSEELLNRFTYHRPTDEQAEIYSSIRKAVLGLATFIVHNTPACEDQRLSLEALDDVMFRANAAIARNGNMLG